jgi:transcriptional regulator
MTQASARVEIWQGTLSLMVLQTLATVGSLHGYGIARRIEAISRHRLTLNYGTLYPALLKLEQQGYVKTSWDASENNRRAKYYTITAAGRRQLAREAAEWRATNAIVDGFLNPSEA